jgi:excisionase family DNA binding protein
MMTVDQLASYLMVTRRTIDRMLKENKLPFAFKIKGSWRFEEKDVREWIERQKGGNK